MFHVHVEIQVVHYEVLLYKKKQLIAHTIHTQVSQSIRYNILVFWLTIHIAVLNIYWVRCFWCAC